MLRLELSLPVWERRGSPLSDRFAADQVLRGEAPEALNLFVHRAQQVLEYTVQFAAG